VQIEKLAELFKVLGDPTRLKMIAILHHRECCVCEFVPLFNISQPAVSKHLSRLKSVGLVKERRKGQWVYYSLNRETMQAIGQALNQLPDCSQDLKQLEENGLLTNLCCE
jgi:ArsR family transcriptional regulator